MPRLHSPSPAGFRWWQPATLVAAVALAFGNGLGAPFLFDDVAAVLTNPTIRELGSWAVLQPPADGGTTTGRPIVNLTFALNYALGGEAPRGYHVVNVLLHAATALLIAGLVRRTLVLRESPATAGDSENAKTAASTAWLAALLWALHPLQTESVTGVAQRTEGLGGFFVVATLYAFVRAATAQASSDMRRWQIAAVAACALGMGSKEIAVAAPLLALLYDRTFLAGTFAGAWRARRGVYLALLATTGIALALLAAGGGSRGVAAGFGLGVSSWDYLLTQAQALVMYLRLAVWPHPLVLDYGRDVVSGPAAVWWQGPLVLALLGGTVWALVRRPRLGFLGAWFFVLLAPSSSFVPLVTQTMAEHRMYLPLLPLAVLAAWGFGRCASAGRTAAGIVAAAALGLTSHARNELYLDPARIWQDTVAKRPNNPRAHNNLGWTLQQQGRHELADTAFARALALAPDYVSAHYNRGVAALQQGRLDAAATHLAEAVRLAPAHADAHLNLGIAFVRLRREADALPHFEATLRLRPGADAHYNRGMALAGLGRAAEAESAWRAALQIEPNLAPAHFQLGRLAETGGNTAAAETHYRAAMAADQSDLAACLRLGLIAARAERWPAAAEAFREAARRRPDSVDAHANLGNVLLAQVNARAAIVSYEAALRLRPGDPRLLENLAVAREAAR